MFFLFYLNYGLFQIVPNRSESFRIGPHHPLYIKDSKAVLVVGSAIMEEILRGRVISACYEKRSRREDLMVFLLCSVEGSVKQRGWIPEHIILSFFPHIAKQANMGVFTQKSAGQKPKLPMIGEEELHVIVRLSPKPMHQTIHQEMHQETHDALRKNSTQIHEDSNSDQIDSMFVLVQNLLQRVIALENQWQNTQFLLMQNSREQAQQPIVQAQQPIGQAEQMQAQQPIGQAEQQIEVEDMEQDDMEHEDVEQTMEQAKNESQIIRFDSDIIETLKQSNSLEMLLEIVGQ